MWLCSCRCLGVGSEGNGSHARGSFVKVVRNILALHFVAAPFGALNLLRNACTFCVSFSISQISLPLASPLRVRALHLETSQPSPVEVVLSRGEVFTINGALFNVFDATSAHNWSAVGQRPAPDKWGTSSLPRIVAEFLQKCMSLLCS